MDEVINKLIDIDKKARDIIEKAEEKSKDMLSSVEDIQKEFEEKYSFRAKDRLKKVRGEEADKLKESCRTIKDRYEILEKKLEKSYFQNHENIENELLKRVIENID